MTYAISEDFEDSRGRWYGYAPVDSTIYSNPAESFLAIQQHVDVRSFRILNELVSVPQDPDLDVPPQTTINALNQTDLELKKGATITDELWQATGTGIGVLTVGKKAGRGGWSSLEATTNGAALSVDLISSLAIMPVDISLQNTLSTIFPDLNSFTLGSCYIQLTSDVAGTFGTGHDSAQILFSANTSVMPQMLCNISSLANAGFDNTAVTGVKIHLVKGATTGSKLTVMAIRALKTGWLESKLDFDTILGAVTIPVTLDGAPYLGTTASSFEFVRGDGSQNDPIPIDGVYNFYFAAGGEAGAEAINPIVNRISALLRERKDIGTSSGSYTEVSLLWGTTSTDLKVQQVNILAGVKTPTAIVNLNIGGSLDPVAHYLFKVELIGTRVLATIFTTTVNQEITSTVWSQSVLTAITNDDYLYRTGRVGYVAALVNRDAYLKEFSVAPTGFARLRTKVYNSRSPVDGAQLSAVYSSDLNLFNAVSGTDILVDQTKTVSGSGSYRTALGVTTNQFIIEDWEQTYLKVAIWVSNNITLANQPVISLNGATSKALVVPKLQPSQWNYLDFDLTFFRDLITGANYTLSITTATEPDRPLGNFWVDDIMVGRRRVAWSARAQADAPFRPFYDMVNDPYGAVHFKPSERGKALQLQAVALTTDAWVSSFKLFPRYAELGLPVYDRGFEIR